MTCGRDRVWIRIYGLAATEDPASPQRASRRHGAMEDGMRQSAFGCPFQGEGVGGDVMFWGEASTTSSKTNRHLALADSLPAVNRHQKKRRFMAT